MERKYKNVLPFSFIKVFSAKMIGEICLRLVDITDATKK